MGVPAVLPLPAAASDRAGCPSCCPWGRMLLWTALLVLAPLASAAGTPSPQAGLPKAVVRLEPPWFNVLRGDSVTLHCQGPHGPGDGPTRWSRDGTPIPTQVQPHFSFRADMNDSGNYRCQTDRTGLSDPAHLNVTSAKVRRVLRVAPQGPRAQLEVASTWALGSATFLESKYQWQLPREWPRTAEPWLVAHMGPTSQRDWLLLQTPRLLLREGDPLVLRCHSWKSQPLFKISFFQDGIAKWYSPANSSFFIPRANVSHGGKYHCSGILGRNRRESHSVRIDVQGVPEAAASENLFPVIIAVAVVAGIAAVAGVAAMVAWVCLRRHRSSGAPKSREVGETPPEEPANLTHAEEAAKAEAENTITYSLLMHPEEDAGLSDYQNV